MLTGLIFFLMLINQAHGLALDIIPALAVSGVLVSTNEPNFGFNFWFSPVFFSVDEEI